MIMNLTFSRATLYALSTGTHSAFKNAEIYVAVTRTHTHNERASKNENIWEIFMQIFSLYNKFIEHDMPFYRFLIYLNGRHKIKI